ncbi:MAG: hypothetical protein K1X95_12625 [Acidimicrobiia bacterium]|nr:hypothetical protein [Acidimicrobiia bacterium]
MARQVAFWAPKGGVGATTLAVNVAAAACEFELRVAYADLDHAGGDGALFFGDGSCDHESPAGSWRHPCGLWGHVAADGDDARALASGLRGGHDFVVLDLPSAARPSDLGSDLLVVVVGADVASLVRSRRALAAMPPESPPVCVVVVSTSGATVRAGDVDAVLGVSSRVMLAHDAGLVRRGDRGVFSYGIHRSPWARTVRALTADLCAGLTSRSASEGVGR